MESLARWQERTLERAEKVSRSPESRIVWVDGADRFVWAREITVSVPRRSGWAKAWTPENSIVVGYSELNPWVESSNLRFRRRLFYLRETDFPLGKNYTPAEEFLADKDYIPPVYQLPSEARIIKQATANDHTTIQ